MLPDSVRVGVRDSVTPVVSAGETLLLIVDIGKAAFQYYRRKLLFKPVQVEAGSWVRV